MNVDGNIIYFENDDDFEAFALGPMQVCSKSDANGNESFYMRHDFTQMYNDAIGCGKKFCIRDVKSRVNKDGLLATKWASYEIPQDSIEMYFDD